MLTPCLHKLTQPLHGPCVGPSTWGLDRVPYLSQLTPLRSNSMLTSMDGPWKVKHLQDLEVGPKTELEDMGAINLSWEQSSPGTRPGPRHPGQARIVCDFHLRKRAHLFAFLMVHNWGVIVPHLTCSLAVQRFYPKVVLKLGRIGTLAHHSGDSYSPFCDLCQFASLFGPWFYFVFQKAGGIQKKKKKKSFLKICGSHSSNKKLHI